MDNKLIEIGTNPLPTSPKLEFPEIKEDANLKTLRALQSYIRIENCETEGTYKITMCGTKVAEFYDITALNIFLEAIGMNEMK